MCGIAGIFDRSEKTVVTEGNIRQMLAMLRHRGPDEFGILLDRSAGLGNARLSIIDLTGGSQPIANEDETLWIVFNGEIFNYIELRTEMESRGHQFRTSSDTEVILHLYEEYGPKSLERMNGQFAIAIWDAERKRLFLARDRLGVRPVFYTQVDGTLFFASEIKALLSVGRVSAELDPAVIEQIFRFWAPLSPNTVFRGIRELPAGHFLVADRDSVFLQRYWTNQFPGNRCSSFPTRRATADLVEEFRELLIDACRIRLRADVPVGAYLSGGLDSSTIAAVIQRYTSNRLVTFSIAFADDKFDESSFQREMALHLGTDHHVVHATHSDIGHVFPDVIWHAETPIMRTAPAPMFLLSKLVRDTGFKVVLTGEGADEFLAGYDIFKEAKVRRFWAREPESTFRPLLLKRLYPDITGLAQSGNDFLAAFFGAGLDEVDSPWYSHAIRWRNNRRTTRFLANREASNEEALLQNLAATLPSEFKSWDPLSRAQYLEISIFLSQYLLSSQGDRMGMAHSVEGRFPFLDTRLVEYCNSQDPRLKMQGLREKYLLKLAAEPWLPPAIRKRPKRPYRAPIHRSFFNESTPDYMRELLSQECVKRAGVFKYEPIAQLVQKIQSGGAVGETDDMALAGIVSTQLVHQLFIQDFQRSQPLSDRDVTKLCKLERKVHSGSPCASPKARDRH